MSDFWGTFATWQEVLHHARCGGKLFYLAPMDTSPRPVRVVKVSKTGTIRLDPKMAGQRRRDTADPFTADAGHLDRMRHRGQIHCAQKRGAERIPKAKKETRIDTLRASLPPGWSVETWAPGDGAVRYRFFHNAPPDQSYFGPANGAHTALGLGEAHAFARGLSSR